MRDTPESRTKFASLLAAMGEVWNREVTTSLTRIFWTALEDLPGVEVVAAMDEHIRLGKFFPVPADIRARVAERMGLVDVAERAWLDVMRWATAPRPKRHVSKALPPASREALAILGGARRVIAAHQRGDNYALTQLRSDFIRVYGEEPRPLLAETAGGAE